MGCQSSKRQRRCCDVAEACAEDAFIAAWQPEMIKLSSLPRTDGATKDGGMVTQGHSKGMLNTQSLFSSLPHAYDDHMPNEALHVKLELNGLMPTPVTTRDWQAQATDYLKGTATTTNIGGKYRSAAVYMEVKLTEALAKDAAKQMPPEPAVTATAQHTYSSTDDLSSNPTRYRAAVCSQ